MEVLCKFSYYDITTGEKTKQFKMEKQKQAISEFSAIKRESLNESLGMH